MVIYYLVKEKRVFKLTSVYIYILYWKIYTKHFFVSIKNVMHYFQNSFFNIALYILTFLYFGFIKKLVDSCKNSFM